MSGDYVGARVRYWRLKRGMSQKMLADFIGLTQSYISQIESGMKDVDKRSTLVRLAEALRVSVADLTDLPGPDFPEHLAADATVPAIRAALNMIRLGATVEPSQGISGVVRVSAELSTLRKAARYDRLAQLLPGVILDLHALSASDDEPQQREALRLMVQTAYNATLTLKYLRYPDLATIAAEQGHAAATRLGEPAWCAVADFTRLHFLPVENKTLTRQLVLQAADRIEPAPNSSDATQAYGMLHLSAALTSAVCMKPEDAWAHVDEAAEVASRVGEGDFASMHFGPTNVAFWRIMVAVELGEGGRVKELARGVNPELIESDARRAGYYTDIARGLAQTRRHDQEAIATFVQAERIAPQWVRLNPAVRETVGAMLRRARADAGGARLRELAARVGVA